MASLAPYIDHTLLKPEVTQDQLAQLCTEAKAHGFATVCVRAEHIAFCAGELRGSSVKPIAVIGFPSGTVPTDAKISEAKAALKAGALELDMVIQIEQLKKRELGAVLLDMQAVVETAGKIPVKVIIETSLLTDEEKIIACALAKAAGAAFVKTSTGFSTGGATEADVRLMRSVVGQSMGVKASGGIRSRADAEKMIAAGANRLGTSAGVAIVSGEKGHDAY